MARFIVIHKQPWTEEEVKGMVKTPLELPTGIALSYTWCDFSAGTFYCEWEGPSKESIEQTLRAMEMPFDAVHLVRRADWVKGELEA